jgi:hypothetical protein
MSNLSLNVLKPEIGARASVVNTYSESLMRGISASTFMAAFDSGSVTSVFVLYRSFGIVHSSPEISDQAIALASVRRQAASNKKRTNCPQGFGKISAVFHTATNSTSDNVRSRSRSRGDRRHAANKRRSELVVADSVPITDAPQGGENLIGHRRAAPVLDIVEQGVDFAALDVVNLPVAKHRIDQPLKVGLSLGGGTQLAAFAGEVAFAYGAKRVPAGLAGPTARGERIAPLGNLAYKPPRLPAGILEAEHAVDGVAARDAPAAILQYPRLGPSFGDHEAEARQRGIPEDRAFFAGLGAGLAHEGRRQLLYRHR